MNKKEQTIKALLWRREIRRKWRIHNRILCVMSVAIVTACTAALIAMEFPVSAESKEPVSVPETAYTVSVVYNCTAEEEVEPEQEPVSLGEFKITHYCACEKCCGKSDGITATGTVATEGRTIAVDPDVIPYGTEVTIRYADGTEHTYVAEDCGGAIQGNRIDVYMNSHEAALVAGVKYGEVFLNA